MKAGFKALLISPRNSIEGQQSLFEKTGIKAFLVAPESVQTIAPLLEAVKVPVHLVPSFAELTNPDPVALVPFLRGATFDETACMPALTLHTSGSTGIPKPIDVKHGAILSCAMTTLIKSPHPDRPLYAEYYRTIKRFLIPLPLFHAGGMLTILNYALYSGIVSVLSPEGLQVTADLIADCIDAANVDGALLAPAIVDEMASSPRYLSRLEKLQYFATGGGPTSMKTAEKLHKHPKIHAVNIIGSTESPNLWLLRTFPDEYPWFCFDESSAGLEMRPHSIADQEQLYEMWIKRLPGDRWREQGVFYTFPDIDEYNTKDLFRKHPTKPILWRYYARSDDVIVLSNGEKLNPVDIEGALQAHPKVKGAVVVGQGRFQPAVIVEPHQHPESLKQETEFIEDLWQTIDALNQQTVTHGVILREMILITSLEKPLPRAGKGTIQRPLANKIYASEIDALFADTSRLGTDALKISTESEATLADSLLRAFRQSLRGRADHLGLDTDIFAAGIDSMQVLAMARNLKAGFEQTGAEVDPASISLRAIYSNATPRKIAHAIFSQLHGASANRSDSDEAGQQAELRSFVKRFSTELPTIPTPSPAPGSAAVLITGTTGALGPHLLANLLASNASHIYAINRSADAPARQAKIHVERGLVTDFSRVTFITSTLAEPDFSIPTDLYEELKTRVGRIIHNAWPVNWTIPLQAFEPSIASVRNLIDFSTAATLHPHIAFVATVGTVSLAPSPVAETPHAPSAAVMGYGQSKAVSAAVLDAARERGIPSAIIRVAQIAGPLGPGVWNEREWFPSLVKSSAGMGLLPADLGATGEHIDWLSVEGVAQVVTGISLASAEGYFHAANPAATTWAPLLDGLKQWFGARCEVVPSSVWVAQLEKRARDAESEEDVARLPAVKLVDFYAGLTKGQKLELETKRTGEVVKGLYEWGPVKKEWMLHWLEQWRY